MKALVTGATGFLGKKVAVRLVKQGYDVTGIGRNEKLGALLSSEGIRFEKVDLEDREKVIGVCKAQDYIIHCGALSSVWGAYEQFYHTNVVGTENLIAGAFQHGIKRFVHVSTPSIYFNLDYHTARDVKENNPIPMPAINNYTKTKFEAEQRIDDAFEKGLPVITIRPRGLFGPEDKAIIPRLIHANKKIGVPIIKGGNALIDVTYVENAVDALLLCMDSDESTLGKKYNITNGEPMPLKTILDKVFKELNVEWKQRKMNYYMLSKAAGVLESIYKVLQAKEEPVLTKYTVSVLSHSQTLNIDAARNELGFVPHVSVEEGIKEFSKWWKEEKSK